MDNKTLLKEADEKLRAFEKEAEPERLREAYAALDGINPDSEQSRRETLAKWLELAKTVDAKLDPKFDPADVPQAKVLPPEGTGLPPGADPAVIADPKLRAKYEADIAAARKKAVDYRLQSRLREVNERLEPRVQAFLRTHFLMSLEDRTVARAAITAAIANEKRRSGLLEQVPLPP